MIDIHTHILPGLDDGPRSWAETLEMCRLAKEDGAEGLVATPHIRDGVYPNRRSDIVEKVNELREKIKGHIDINIFCGAEIHITPDIVDRIKRGEVPTINDKGYILLELPDHLVPPRIEDLLFQLKLERIIPIITHVERSHWIQREFQLIYRFVEMGALMQITAMSLTGGLGRTARRMAMKLVKLRLAHVIASDSHSRGLRPPGLSFALKIASSIVGEKEANAMVKDAPAKIINGSGIEIPVPERT
ncbi:MAG: capsular biosynthesis protein [Deltaproteobacteria bacterium]|nr:capsular biosynthesis protein [Deltaproteobacteria bacterium]